MKLIQFMAAAGFAPHHAARHIRYGRVRVNGAVITDTQREVTDADRVDLYRLTPVLSPEPLGAA